MDNRQSEIRSMHMDAQPSNVIEYHQISLYLSTNTLTEVALAVWSQGLQSDLFVYIHYIIYKLYKHYITRMYQECLAKVGMTRAHVTFQANPSAQVWRFFPSSGEMFESSIKNSLQISSPMEQNAKTVGQHDTLKQSQTYFDR